MPGPELAATLTAVTTLKRHPWVGVFVLTLTLVFLTGADAKTHKDLRADIAAKVDTVVLAQAKDSLRADVRALTAEVGRLKGSVDSLAIRQREYFCLGKPSFCR